MILRIWQTIGRSIIVLVLVVNAAVCVAEEVHPSYAIGVQWLLHAQQYSFFGLSGRVGLAKGMTGAFIEMGFAFEPDNDDLVFSLEGAGIIYVGSERDKSYLGIGLGWARWEDWSGWDRGVWLQSYSKFLIGSNLPFAKLPLFIEAAITLGSWFNPVLTVGARF